MNAPGPLAAAVAMARRHARLCKVDLDDAEQEALAAALGAMALPDWDAEAVARAVAAALRKLRRRPPTLGDRDGHRRPESRRPPRHPGATGTPGQRARHARNLAVCLASLGGMSQRRLAVAFGLTRSVIGAILAEYEAFYAAPPDDAPDA